MAQDPCKQCKRDNWLCQQFFPTKAIDKNGDNSSSDKNNSNSDEKDKKPATKMIAMVIVWRVGRVRRVRTLCFLTQVTKKRETKRREAGLKNARKAMVLVSIASVWPSQSTQVGEAI